MCVCLLCAYWFGCLSSYLLPCFGVVCTTVFVRAVLSSFLLSSFRSFLHGNFLFLLLAVFFFLASKCTCSPPLLPPSVAQVPCFRQLPHSRPRSQVRFGAVEPTSGGCRVSSRQQILGIVRCRALIRLQISEFRSGFRLSKWQGVTLMRSPPDSQSGLPSTEW